MTTIGHHLLAKGSPCFEQVCTLVADEIHQLNLVVLPQAAAHEGLNFPSRPAGLYFNAEYFGISHVEGRKWGTIFPQFDAQQ